MKTEADNRQHILKNALHTPGDTYVLFLALNQILPTSCQKIFCSSHLRNHVYSTHEVRKQKVVNVVCALDSAGREWGPKENICEHGDHNDSGYIYLLFIIDG